MLAPAEEGTVMQGADGRVVLCNAAAERILGVSLSQLLGQTALDPGWRAVEGEHPALRTLRTGEALEGARLGVQRPDGTVAWLWVRTRALRRDPGEGVWGVVSTFQELGSELAAQGPGGGVRTPEVFWELDFVRNEVRAQPSFEAGLGLETPRPSAWLAAVAPEERGAVERAWTAHLEGRTDLFDVECRWRTGDGEWRWVRGRSRVVAWREDGRPALVAGTLGDVTRLRAREEQLSATERLASVGTLAAGMAHEINNPLAWISGNLGYVLETLGEPHADEDELRSALQEAQEGVARVAEIVRRLRAFGKPGSSQPPTRIQVREAVDQALALCRHEVSHRARLVVDVPGDLPEVVASAQELSQALVHLLRNAAQAIPEGRSQAHQVSVGARAANGELLLEVRDTGAGIPPEVRSRIFDPFFTTRSPREGTGLGLSVCHGIVAGAGGRIEVESTPGQGSCFRVVLPAAPEAAPRRAPAARPPSRRRVLVVEDEPLVGRAIARMLEAHHEVRVATTAADAFRRLEAGERFHLVLCDLMLPDTTGMELFERLGRTVPRVLPRVTFMTGGAFTEDAQRFLETRQVPSLLKPLDAAVLLGRIAAAPELD